MGVPQDAPAPRKSIFLPDYGISLTRRIDGVNITGQIGKKAMAEVFEAGLVPAEAEG
jgi:hypothetical protein